MYPVTEQWKAETELPLRNYSWIRIVFGITDPDAPQLSTLTDNGHLSFSTVDSSDVGTSVPSTYQTLERNRFILDGKNPLPLDENPIYQGYAGSDISGDDGIWATPPEVTIVFSDYVQFPGLTFQFDESMDEYPTEFQILAYHDSTEVLNITITPNKSAYEYGDKVPICSKIILRWIKSKTPHRRSRMALLIYGLVSELTTEDIKDCTFNKEISLDSTKLPKQDFKFTLIDKERRYDPENPKGVWEYLESRQPVNYYYGYQLSDGSIEWIPWGVSYSTGKFSVTQQSIVSNVTVECAGLANHLNMTYDEGTYYPDGISLYDLAEKVMAFAGFANTIELDDELKNITTHNPLPTKSVSNCLQLIANAGHCIISHSRGGYITIKREDTTMTGFDLSFKKIKDTPKTSKIAPLRMLNTEYTMMYAETDSTNAIQDYEITNANAQEFTFTHNAYTNQTLTVSSGLTIVGDVKYFAYKTVATLTGTGTVNITGKALKSNKLKYSKKYSDVGEDLSPSANILVDSLANAKAYSDWLAEVTLRRNSYEVSDRGYPELDVGDYVNFTSNFYNDIAASIVKQQLSFSGAISGTTKLIIGSDDT